MGMICINKWCLGQTVSEARASHKEYASQGFGLAEGTVTNQRGVRLLSAKGGWRLSRALAVIPAQGRGPEPKIKLDTVIVSLQ